MKYILIAISAASSYLMASGLSAAETEEGRMCTLEYAPICAKIQVQCLRAPCYPIYKTFGNKCEMAGDTSAVEVHKGRCTTFEEGNQAIISESLKASISRQYDAFLLRISNLEGTSRLSRLEAVNRRISEKMVLNMPNPSLGLMQEMANDRLRQILSYLKDMNDSQIFMLQGELTGKRYLFMDVQKCESARFSCSEGEEVFFDEKGCGCKR